MLGSQRHSTAGKPWTRPLTTLERVELSDKAELARTTIENVRTSSTKSKPNSRDGAQFPADEKREITGALRRGQAHFPRPQETAILEATVAP
jgi:hypothetical protein